MSSILVTMLLKTLIVLIVLAIFITGWQLLKKGGRRNWFKGRSRLSAGIEASALVLLVEETGVIMDRQPLIRVQVQVLPEKGRNFVVEVREVFSAPDYDRIRSGNMVRVKYNPDNLKETYLIR